MALIHHNDRPIGALKSAPLFCPDDSDRRFRGQYRPINPWLLMARKNGIPDGTYYGRVSRGMDKQIAATMPAQSHSDVAKRQKASVVDGRYQFVR